jgi:hypothetical protein
MSDRKFIWANSPAQPTYKKLDRILVAMDWEQKYPLSTVTALSRDISDHAPLFLDTRQNSLGSNYNQFKFKLGWLLRDGFREMVTNIWVNENKEGSVMERWQTKI